MTSTGRTGDEIYPLLLDWRDGDKLARETAAGLLMQEFTPIARRYAPRISGQERDDLVHDMISDFFQSGETENSRLPRKLIPANPDNPRAYRRRIFNNHCFNFRKRLINRSLRESIDSLPEQQEINQQLIERRASHRVTGVVETQGSRIQVLAKRELLHRFIFWVPILQRTSIAQVLGINPIVWHREYAAYKGIPEEDAYSILMRFTTIEADPAYRRASDREGIRMKMAALLDEEDADKLYERYKKHIQKARRELQRLIRWSEHDMQSRKAMLTFHHLMIDRVHQIVLGAAYHLPTEMYVTHLKVFHLISEDEALETVENFDHRDWVQRNLLIAPYDEPKVGRDSRTLFEAIDDIEKIARRESLRC